MKFLGTLIVLWLLGLIVVIIDKAGTPPGRIWLLNGIKSLGLILLIGYALFRINTLHRDLTGRKK